MSWEASLAISTQYLTAIKRVARARRPRKGDGRAMRGGSGGRRQRRKGERGPAYTVLLCTTTSLQRVDTPRRKIPERKQQRQAAQAEAVAADAGGSLTGFCIACRGVRRGGGI